jgi:hypothetical protein
VVLYLHFPVLLYGMLLSDRGSYLYPLYLHVMGTAVIGTANDFMNCECGPVKRVVQMP